MLTPAVEALAEGLKANDARLRLTAAVHVLRAIGLYGEVCRKYGEPTGPTTPEDVEKAGVEAEAWARFYAPLLRPPK